MNKPTELRRESEAGNGTRDFRVIDFNSATASKEVATDLVLEPVVSRDAFEQLKDEWDTFLAKTQTPSPFLSWDYLDVWWDTYGDKGFAVNIFIARDSQNHLVGAAPLMISRKGAFPGTRSNFRHLAIIGSLGGAAGESLELPAIPGYEVMLGEAVAKHILESMQGMWDVLYLNMIPHDSRSTNTMIRQLALSGMAIKTVGSIASPILPVSGSWDDYIANCEFKVRGRIANAFSQGAYSSQELELLRAGREIAFEEAYEELIKLTKASGNKRFEDVFGTRDMIDFHWKLAPRLLEQGKLFFGIVRMHGEVAGAVYDFMDYRKMWARQALWNPDFADSDIQVVLNTWSDKAAFDRGLEEIDYLLGSCGRDLAETRYSRTLNSYEAVSPKSIGGMLFSLARGVDQFLQNKTPNKK